MHQRVWIIAQDSTETPLGNTLALGTSSAALVYDTSNFGATSPVAGQRYRLEAAPTFGTISFTSVAADYRRYFMPVSFCTLAARVLHYGRYGAGGEDERLFPLFIGYPNLVRGYDVGSFRSSEWRRLPRQSDGLCHRPVRHRQALPASGRGRVFQFNLSGVLTRPFCGILSSG